MKRPAAVLIATFALFLNPSQVGSDSLQKAYFAATPPGAWATYESSWEMPDGMAGVNSYTYIRAADDADRVRIEISTHTLSGPGEGMTTTQLFIMESDFDLDTNFLNRMSSLEASIAQTGEGPATLMQDNVVEILRTSGGDLTNSVTFKGSETIDGRECDLYAYSYQSGGPHVTLQEGEICLDETVPFGVVFQKGQTKDQAGALASSFEQTLVDSGTGKPASAALLAMTPAATSVEATTAAPEAAASLQLSQAYESGTIRLFVEALEGTGGRRLEISAVNQSDEPFDLVVPSGPLALPAGSPIGELKLHVDEEHRFSLAPGARSPSFSAGQTGDRGVTGGSFQLTVYEGEPLYQGSVEIGPLG